MSVDDDLIDPRNLDWARLLSGWSWLLPAKFEVWLMNRFGDLFLVFNDGSLYMLDVGCGRLNRLANSRDEFADIVDEGDNAHIWLMIPLVDDLVEARNTLEADRCYSFLTPPILGGEYSVENTRVIPIEELYGLYGSYHDQLNHCPEGQKSSSNRRLKSHPALLKERRPDGHDLDNRTLLI